MESQHTPGLSDYFGAIKRRRGLLVGLGLPIAVIAALLAVALPDIYRSTGLIEIEPVKGFAGMDATPGEPSYADQYVSSLKGSVLGDANLRKLLAKYELYPAERGSGASALSQLRDDIKVEIVTVPILDPRTGREREVVTAFTVAYENRSPDKAQQGAIWLVQEFLAANRLHYQKRAASAAQFFAAEADRVGSQIALLESQLADFKNKNLGRLPELAESNINMMDRTDRDLEAIQLQIRTLRQERVFLTAQLEEAQTANPQANTLRQLEEEYQRKAVVYDESHPDLVSLRRQIENLKLGGPAGGGTSLQEQLEAQRSILAETRQRYSEDHPDVRRIARGIEALQARIASGERSDSAPPVRTPIVVQLQTQINAIDSQLSALGVRSGELRSKLEDVQKRVVSAPQVEREYQTVTRDISIARAKYDELLNRQMDAQVAEAAIAGGRADEFRLSQPPLKPAEPAKPPRIAIALIGAILALVIGLTGTVAAEGLDRTVRGARDVRSLLAVSPLASVPNIQNSLWRRRRATRALAMAASFVLGVSGLYYIIQLWV